jgi:membrane protein
MPFSPLSRTTPRLQDLGYMAQLKDVPKVVKRNGVVGLAKKVWAEVTKDEVFTWGSALAYAWIFAIFPFMIFLLTLAPYLPGGTKERILQEVQKLAYGSMGLGGEAGFNVVKMFEDIMTNQKGGLLSVGLILALWGASGGMSMTMDALNKAYYVQCTRGFVKQRLMAIGLTVASAVLILVVMFLLPIGAAIVDHLHMGIVGKVLVNVLRYGIALGLLFTIVAMIYYFGPCVRTKWQTVTPGAVFTVAVWILLGFTFALYVKNFGSFNKTYGALGGAIIMLLFFYINAVVLVIGAEVNSVIDFETLDVKPGTADLTQAKAKAEYEENQAEAGTEKKPATSGGPGEKQRRPADGRPSPFPQPATAGAGGGKGKKVLVVGSALLATKWAWGKWSERRAQEKARERAIAEARKRWLAWAAS